jgi:origin recognition complex subunit 4
LTPTKNRGQTPKSVKFDKRVNSEMFFEDLPTDTTPKKTTTPRKPREKKDEVDEIVCGLCSRPNSKAPNQIILCDVCDFAVHQECYGVTEIPDGEWLCKSCDQADALVATPAKKSTPQEELATIPAADVPDIPNFEHHLRSLQRVLLDRCAGRRRINMFGQQDVHEKVQQLVEQTVVAGEGNSMLVIGARGSGKTTVSRPCRSLPARIDS